MPTDQPFCDEFVAGVQRTGNWALDILNVDAAVVPEAALPEPGTLALGLLGGLLLLPRGARSRT